MGRRYYVLLRPWCNFPIRYRGDVLLRRIADVLPERCWVFHLRRICNVAGTYRKASLLRPYDVLLPGWT